MSVDMLGAIIPKDISICLVVQEIARQIDHFTRELAANPAINDYQHKGRGTKCSAKSHP